MSASNNNTYTLRYFPLIGLAEISRLLLTASKVQWEEEHPEWPQEKEAQPFGRLPVLIEKHADGSPDFVISESPTIERYLAHTYGFLPADWKQAARQEQYRDQMYDAFAAYVAQIHAKPEKKQELRDHYVGLLERMVRVHSKAICENGNNGHYFGDKLTYIDLVAYGFIKMFSIGHLDKYEEGTRALFKSKISPEFIKLVEVVEADPLLAEYVSKGDKMAAAFN